jgi:hypothetical protein
MAFPFTSYARTLSQIVAATQRLCNDYRGLNQNGRIWTWQEVSLAANDVVKEMVRQAGGLRSTQQTPLVAGQEIYTLPTNCIRPVRIGLYGVEAGILLPSTITQLDLTGTARNAAGTPLRFRRDHLAPNQIAVIPLSSSATTGTGDLHVHYERKPTRMSARGDYPDSGIPEWTHKDIPYGAAAHLLRNRRTKLAQMKFQRFALKWQATVNVLKSRVQQSGPLGREVRPL